MLKAKFTALASLGVLAAAPLAAQAEMVEMADAEMSDVNGQGLIGDTLAAIGGALTDPLVLTPPTTSYPVTSFEDVNNNGIPDAGDIIIRSGPVKKEDKNYLPAAIGSAVGDSVNNANKGLINFGLLPLNLFGDAIGATNDAVRGAGRSVIGTALLPLTGPTAMVAGFNTRAIANFTSTGQSVADTAVRLVTTPVRAVINPINGAMDDVAALGKGLVSGARFSAVGAVGGATTRVLAGAAAQTNSRLLTNLAYASDQARVQQQNKIGTTMGVTVTVPKYTVSTSLLKP